jgi:hypothetical protein
VHARSGDVGLCDGVNHWHVGGLGGVSKNALAFCLGSAPREAAF